MVCLILNHVLSTKDQYIIEFAGLPHEKYPNTSDETVEKPDAVTHSFYNFKENSVDNCSDENANELAFNITWAHRGRCFEQVSYISCVAAVLK